MKTKFGTKLLSLLLCVCMLIPMFTACGNKDDDPPREPETYYTSMAVKYNPNGEYEGSLAFSDDVDDTFTDLSAENFTLTVYSHAGETEVSANLNDFSIKKTDEKNLEFAFKSPFGYDEDVSYILMSETAVTAKENKIAAVIYVYTPTPELDIEYVGSYQGTDQIKIIATLTDDWKFADDITADMLSFPEGFDASVTIARESDNKVVFSVSDLPENFTGVAIPAILSKNAIASEFSTDVYLHIDYFRPEISVDPLSVTFDEEAKTLTVEKLSLPEGVTGADSGISVSSTLYSVAEQTYDATNRTYAFRLKLDDSLLKNTDITGILPFITAQAYLKTENEEIHHSFNLYGAIAGVTGKLITDVENEKLYIEITPYNATFAEDFSAANVTVTGANGLANFIASSSSPEKLVYVADYTAAITEGVAVTFDMSGDALNTDFRLNSYSLMLYVPPYSEGRDIDWGKLGGKLAKSAAGGIGSAIGSSLMGFVLPHVYDFLDIDTSDPELNAIRESITQLTYAISDMSNDIGNIVDQIETSTNRQILDNFQSIETSLLTTSLKLLGDEAVVEYAFNIDGLTYISAKEDYERFREYVILEYGSWEDAELYWGEFVSISLSEFYNLCCDYANSLSFEDFKLKMLSMEGVGYRSYPTLGGNEGLDTKHLYDLLQNARPFDENDTPKETPTQYVEGFLNAVDKMNGNLAYITNVADYGNRILGNAGGTSSGIIDLFFQVVDNTYNFESQTIAAKKAFVAKLQSVYLLNMAIAIQYCDASGDTGNANLLRANVNAAMHKIDAAFKKIDEMEARAAKGNDKLLVSGQVVSKEMVVCDLSSEKYQFETYRFQDAGVKQAKTDCVSVSLDSISTMINRALRRGVSLAEDLTGAGFTNITSGWDNESKQYFYLSASLAGTPVYSTDHVAETFFCGIFGAAMGIDWEELNAQFIANFVGQNGKGEPTFYRNNCVMEWFHVSDAYRAGERITTRTCKCLMGFGFAQ